MFNCRISYFIRNKFLHKTDKFFFFDYDSKSITVNIIWLLSFAIFIPKMINLFYIINISFKHFLKYQICCIFLISLKLMQISIPWWQDYFFLLHFSPNFLIFWNDKRFQFIFLFLFYFLPSSFLIICLVRLFLIDFSFFYYFLDIHKRLNQILWNWFLINGLLKLIFGIVSARINFHVLLLFVLSFLSRYRWRYWIYYCIFRFWPITHKILIQFLYENSMRCIFPFVNHSVQPISYKLL